MSQPSTPTPFDLVSEALDFIQSISLKRQEVGLDRIRKEVLSEARAFTSLDEAHQAIRDVLRKLEDNHSFLWTAQGVERHKASSQPGFRLHQNKPIIIDIFPAGPAEKQGLEVGDRITKVGVDVVSAKNWSSYFVKALDVDTELSVFDVSEGKERQVSLASGFKITNPVPSSFVTPQGYGLIDLPGHMGDGKLEDKLEYAQVVRDAFYDLERQAVTGWIIDLRRNDGGNMWPMLAGLTPLLGIGTYGSFVDPVEAKDWLWRFDEKEMGSYEKATLKPDYTISVPDFRPLANPDAPVAILTSDVTSSSGELVLIGILGRHKTRTFGVKTGGLSSSNAMQELSDGSSLFVTGHWGADRLGRIYKGAILPDVTVDPVWSLYGQDNDPVILAAEAWLQTQISQG